MSPFWGILWAAAAAAAFGIVFNVRGRDLAGAALGGASGWALYLLLSGGTGYHGVGYFAASAAVALYAEAAATLLKRPATTYLACALIPLVPGGGMYYTLSRSLEGDLGGTLAMGFQTLTVAGAIAAGVAVGSAAARLARRF